MRKVMISRSGLGMAAAVIAALGLCAQEKKEPVKAEGIPPRAAPTDYQFHGQAGTLTVAAEFTGHAIATPESTLMTEDYVAIETAVYGPADTKMNLSRDQFSLRLNGKKALLASQPYGLVVKTLKDPEIEPTAAETKSKTSVNAGGGQQADNSPPPPFRVPDNVRREWGQRLQRESLPEGERVLPQAGLIYFPFHGKTEKLQSIELIYTGPSGSVTLALAP
jgi:hypothetical protein